MSVLTKRRQTQTEVSAAGQEEPVNPAYNKNATPSPVFAHMEVPSEPTRWDAPYVNASFRTNGMRYLYAHGAVRQPLQRVGHGEPNIGIAVDSSEFQPLLIGPIHDAGFNDRLFQAGYPGFNLGLSFKTQQNPSTGLGGGTTVSGLPTAKQPQFRNIVVNFQRAFTTGKPRKAEGQP